MGAPVPLDPARYGNVLARLQQSPSEAVRFAVQAEMNAEVLEQQEQRHVAQLQSLIKQVQPPAEPPPEDPPKAAKPRRPKRALSAVESPSEQQS